MKPKDSSTNYSCFLLFLVFSSLHESNSETEGHSRPRTIQITDFHFLKPFWPERQWGDQSNVAVAGQNSPQACRLVVFSEWEACQIALLLKPCVLTHQSCLLIYEPCVIVFNLNHENNATFTALLSSFHESWYACLVRTTNY